MFFFHSIRLKVDKKYYFFSILFFLFFILSFNAYSQDLKIGFVSTEKILKESNIAKNAQSKIESEFVTRNKELHDLEKNLRDIVSKLDKDSIVLSDSDRIKRQREIGDLDVDLQRKRRAFQEDFNRRRNEEFSVVISITNECIKKIAEKDGYDLILEDAVAVNPRIDITEEVIKNLNG